MAERKVFGRRWFKINGTDFKVELRKNGVYVRQRGHRTDWWLPPSYLLHLCKRQLEFYNERLDASQQSQPMPSVQEIDMVLDRDKASALHAGPVIIPEDS